MIDTIQIIIKMINTIQIIIVIILSLFVHIDIKINQIITNKNDSYPTYI